MTKQHPWYASILACTCCTYNLKRRWVDVVPRATVQTPKWWSAPEDIGLSASSPSSQARMRYQQLTNWNGACPALFEVYSLLHTCQMHLSLAEGQSCKQATSLPSLITFGSKVSQQRDPGIHARAPWQTHTHTDSCPVHKTEMASTALKAWMCNVYREPTEPKWNRKDICICSVTKK